MATRSIALGHEFDLLHDDDEETVVGSPPHQGAIVVLDTGLNLCARRRGLPWFVGNQQPILIPRAGYGPPRRLLPDIWVHPTLTPTGRSPLLLAAGGYVLWEPDAAGRWASAALGIAFRPQGLLLRIYDQDGRLVPTIDEQDARIAALEEELRRLRGGAGGESPPA